MNRPRVLIVGSDMVWSIERFYRSHIQDMGVEISIFPAQNILYEFLGKSIFHRIAHRLGLASIYRDINERLREAVIKFSPDVVWVFKGMEVMPETLKWLRSIGIKLANYNPDNPFIFSGRGSGNSNVTRGISYYDLHFTYDRYIQLQLQEKYNANVSILPFGFEITNEVFESADDQQEVMRVCFLGNLDRTRFSFVKKLVDAGIEVDVYGHNNSFGSLGSKLRLLPAVYGNEFWRVLRRYRVQLNLMRPHNLNSHNMRSFEIPGIGGIGLFPATSDHSTYFTPDQHIFLFQNEKELVAKANWLMGLSEHEARIIRDNARLYSLKMGYDYKSRARFAYEQIVEILPKK